MTIHRRSFFIVGALLLVLLAMAADFVVVKIQVTAVRKTPQFFAPVIAPLKAGDRLEKISESNGWVQVKTVTGVIGWVHSSALETPKINLLAANSTMKTQASASEVALAGKGFNKQVEDSYKAKHGELNFAAVDSMLQVKIPAAEIENFLRKGRLGGLGGVK